MVLNVLVVFFVLVLLDIIYLEWNENLCYFFVWFVLILCLVYVLSFVMLLFYWLKIFWILLRWIKISMIIFVKIMIFVFWGVCIIIGFLLIIGVVLDRFKSNKDCFFFFFRFWIGFCYIYDCVCFNNDLYFFGVFIWFFCFYLLCKENCFY